MLILEFLLWALAFGFAGWLVYKKTKRGGKYYSWRFIAWVLWFIAVAPLLYEALGVALLFILHPNHLGPL